MNKILWSANFIKKSVFIICGIFLSTLAVYFGFTLIFLVSYGNYSDFTSYFAIPLFSLFTLSTLAAGLYSLYIGFWPDKKFGIKFIPKILKNIAKISGISFAVVALVSCLIIFAIFALAVGSLLFWSANQDKNPYYYKINETNLLYTCKNSGEIYSGKYKYTYEKPYSPYHRDFTEAQLSGEIVYYQNDSRKVALNEEFSDGIILANPGNGFAQDRQNSVFATFPKYKFMQDKLTFANISKFDSIQNIQDLPLKKTGTALFINPDRISTNEFYQIANCLKQFNQQNQISSISPSVHSGILVYQKPFNALSKTPNTEIIKAGIYSEFSCPGDDVVWIENDASARHGYYQKNDKGNYTVRAEYIFGYFDQKGKFVREKDIPQDGELKNCKNSSDKTIFDIFEKLAATQSDIKIQQQF
ncbi:MAG: hypothetical protein WCK98_06285 [bacterium]